MKKRKNLKSCLVSILSTVVIVFAILYELKIDWAIDIISAKSLLLGASLAVFLGSYGSFDVFEIGAETEKKKESKLHGIRRGLEDGEFTRDVIALFGATKAYISNSTLSTGVEWLFTIFVGILILLLIIVIAWLAQMIVYVMSNWKKIIDFVEKPKG